MLGRREGPEPTRPAAIAPVLGVAAVSLTLAVGARTGTAHVTLTVDGASSNLATHAGTVSALLLEQQVRLGAGDLVVPGPDERLVDDSTVVVQRSRPVVVLADGRRLERRSHGRSALAVLEEAGVRLRPSDRIDVNGVPWPVDKAVPDRGTAVKAPRLGIGVPLAALGPDWLGGAGGGQTTRPAPAEVDRMLPGAADSWTIQVHRAVPVTVVEAGIPLELELAGITVGDALDAAGVPLDPADEVHPPRDAPLDGVLLIRIERAVPFAIEVSGSRTEVKALAHTVGDGLAATGFRLGAADRVEPAVDALLQPGATVRITRVEEEIFDTETEIPFSRVTQADPSMVLDDTVVLRSGEPGLKRQRIKVVYEDGEEIDREVLDEAVLREPVEEIVAYGTQIVWRTVDTPEGPKRYWRKLRVYATSYSLSRSGTPKTAPWYGYTRSGLPMRKGIVGINPRIIPWMTNLYVPGYGIGIAADTGGGIGTYHVDLGYDDDNYEQWHWYVDAYLLEPLPPDNRMTWILP